MEGRVEKKNAYENKHNVLYLMRRDQRLHENYAVQLGYELSYESGSRLYLGVEIFKLKMNTRQRDFVLEGLAELSKEARKHNVELLIIRDLEAFAKSHEVGSIVLDFCPLRESTQREKQIHRLCEKRKIALCVCDAHNIVPCKLLDRYKRTAKAVKTDLSMFFAQYLVGFNKVEAHKFNGSCGKRKGKAEMRFEDVSAIGEFALAAEINLLPRKKEALRKENRVRGGYSNGTKAMEDFFGQRFNLFAKQRNNPDVCASSGLSPWINFGQISAQAVVGLAHSRFEKADRENLESFIKEAFIWREIAEHFVYHERNYDSIDGALAWARDSLLAHAQDKRKVVFSREQLESGSTGDALWDAAQRQLVDSGKMHGYVRMYWAKQLLWWTEDPTSALCIAVHLNDTYAMDGNNPNGYLGIMWSICGSMDRAFKEREVLGKIRPMKAFEAPAYIKRWGGG